MSDAAEDRSRMPTAPIPLSRPRGSLPPRPSAAAWLPPSARGMAPAPRAADLPRPPGHSAPAPVPANTTTASATPAAPLAIPAPSGDRLRTLLDTDRKRAGERRRTAPRRQTMQTASYTPSLNTRYHLFLRRHAYIGRALRRWLDQRSVRLSLVALTLTALGFAAVPAWRWLSTEVPRWLPW